MPTLAFAVETDLNEVIRFKQEIARLENELQNLNSSASPKKIEELEKKLATCREEMQKLIDKAAVAGNEFEAQTDKMAKSLQSASGDIVSAIERLGQKLDKLSTSEAAEQMEELGDKTGDATDEMEDLGDKTEDTTKTVKDGATGMSSAMTKVGAAIAGAFAVDKIQQFITKIAQVRSEFQSYEISFRTMLGSEEKAANLMAELTKTAAITPFNMSDVTNGAKQLIAFGESAETVNDTLVRLGDIAAGTGAQVGQLTLVYGQVMAAGKLNGGDLIQFINAGVPIISSLAKTMGVAESKVKDLISAGKVGFPQVQAAIKSLTDEGSQFGGMMEAQSHTIQGQMSSLEDAIDQAFNEIGKKGEGAFNAAFGVANKLVENYETIGRVLVSLIATYGAYKAAVIAVTATENIRYQLALAHGQGLTTLGAITDVLRAKTEALNKTMLANPYVLLATGVVALVAALWNLDSAEEKVTAEVEAYNRAQDEEISKANQRIDKANELIDVAKNEASSTDTRRLALVQLEQRYPSIFAKYDTEAEKLRHILEIKNAIAELEGKKTSKTTQKATLESEIKALQKEIDARKTGSKIEYNKAYEGTSTQELMTRLRARQTSLKEVNKGIQKDNADAYLANLSGVGNKTLAAQIKVRRDLINRLTLNGRKKGYVKGAGALSGEYTLDQLKGQLQLLEAEQNKRNETKKSVKEWGNDAQAAYQKALKAQQDFVNGKDGRKKNMSQADAEAELEKLNKAVEEAKKNADKWKPGEDKAANAAAKKQEQAAAKAERDAERRKQAEQRAGDILVSIVDDNEQRAAEVMDNSLANQQKLIDAAHQKKVSALKKQARELAELNQKSDKTGLGEDGLTDEQRKAIEEAKALADKAQQKESRELRQQEVAAMRSYLKEYGTYQQQKLAIAEEYAEKIAKAENEAQRKTLEAQQKKALGELDKKHFTDSSTYQMAYGNLDFISTDMLKTMLSELEQYKDEIAKNLDPTELREFQKTLDNVIAEIAERDPINNLKTSIEELATAQEELNSATEDVRKAQTSLEAIRNSNAVEQAKAKEHGMTAVLQDTTAAEKRLTEAINRRNKAQKDVVKANTKINSATKKVLSTVDKMSSSLNSLGSAVGGIAGSCIGMIGDIGKVVSNGIDGMQQAAKAGSKAMQAVERASVILTIISAAIQLLQKLKDIIPDAFGQYEKAAEKQAAINDLTQAVNDYTLAVMKAKQADENWFGNNTLKSLTLAKEQQQQALKSYYDELYEAQATYQNKSGSGWLSYLSPTSWAGLLGLGDTGEQLAKWFGADGIGWASPTMRKYKAGMTAAMNNLRIETREASSGVLGTGIGGHSQQTQDLRQWAKQNLGKDLFNGKGMVDKELAQTLLDNYGDKMVGETKQTLETLKKYREEYDKYVEQLREYVSNLYEPLADNFVDDLWTWFDSGKDALTSFQQAAGDTFRNIVSDMMKTIVLQKVFGKFQDNIADIYEDYSNGSLGEAAMTARIATETSSLMNRMQASMPMLEQTMNSIAGQFEKLGISMHSTASEGNATINSAKSITDDTANHLVGLVNAVNIAQNQSLAVAQDNNKNILTMSVTLGELASHSSEVVAIADETRDILANSYMELQEINLNTRNTAKALETTNSRLQEVVDKL